MSNGLYPDQNRRSVGTELGPNYLQMLSADKERVGNLGNNEYKVLFKNSTFQYQIAEVLSNICNA